MGLRSLLASTLLLAGTMAFATPAQAAPVPRVPIISAKVAAEVQDGGTIRAVVETWNGINRDAIAEVIAAASDKAEVKDRTSATDFLVAVLDRTALDKIRSDERVRAIYKDELSAASLDASTRLIGSYDANRRGWTGRGATVAVLDTGIDRDHPFFAGRIRREACFSTADDDPHLQARSLCPNGQEVQEGAGAADAEIPACVVRGTNRCAHGTHVAGIAAGKATGDAPAGGVAPEAGLLPIQVFTRFDGPICAEQGVSAPCFLSYTSDQKVALQYVDRHFNGLNIAAANLSLGFGPKHTTHCDDDLDYAGLLWEIRWLMSWGVTTVVAAGNNGHTDGVSAPACISKVVAVGATDDSDAVAPLSNRGPLLDLFAPGMGIESSVTGGRYDARNGTSMSAAHVSGALALMRQAYPDGSVDEAGRLVSTGKAVTYGAVTTRRLDVGAALPYTPDPPPTPGPTITPGPEPTGRPTVRPTPAPTVTPTITPRPGG